MMEKCRRTNTPIAKKYQDQVTKLSKKLATTSLEGLINGTRDLTERIEARYVDELVAAAPNSLSCFVEAIDPSEPPARHHEFMCTYLEAIERRDVLRAAFSMAPGHGKSKFCSKYMPAWYLGRNPRHKFLSGGHTQTFCENEFGKIVRDIIREPTYGRIFPETTIHTRSTSAGNWKLANLRGGYVTKGVGQRIAGYRAHIGAIDDAYGSREDADSPAAQVKTNAWMFSDFQTRLLPGAPFYMVATRWNQVDLIGVIEGLNKAKRGIPWEIINLNILIEDEYEAAIDPLGRDIGELLWPDFYTAQTIQNLKETLPDRDWFSLYKGTPRNTEGNVVKAGWFRRYRYAPKDIFDGKHRMVERKVKSVWVSVDTATSTKHRAAYSVAMTIVEGTDNLHYLVDVKRKKVEFIELQDMINEAANAAIDKFGRCDGIMVEDKNNGTAYIQAWKGKAPAPIIAITPEQEGSKEFRMDAVTPVIEAGEFLIPLDAMWLADFVDEILMFPNSRYKDQTDALSQYLNRRRKRRVFGMKKLVAANLTHSDMDTASSELE